MGILALGERQRVRLFIRRDPFERFVTCLVYLPRDRFNTRNRERVQEIHGEAFDCRAHRLRAAPVGVGARAACTSRSVCGQGMCPITTGRDRGAIAESDRLVGGRAARALLSEAGEEQGTALYRRYERCVPGRLSRRVDRALGGGRHPIASSSSSKARSWQ
jgi:glutamate dehydrogenase